MENLKNGVYFKQIMGNKDEKIKEILGDVDEHMAVVHKLTYVHFPEQEVAYQIEQMEIRFLKTFYGDYLEKI